MCKLTARTLAVAVLAFAIPASASASGLASVNATRALTLAEITLLLFTLSNSARVLAYIPQIVTTVKSDANSARGVSCFTWALFLMSNLTTVAYAVVNLGDWLMAAMFTGSALGCIAIIGVAVWRRRCACQIRK